MEVFPYRELILASSFNLHQVPACASTGSVCVVERSFAWAARFRRLARDYEHLSADQLAVGPVKGDGGLNVDIGEAVAVDHAEGVFAFQVLSDAAQTASGSGVVAGVDQGEPLASCRAPGGWPLRTRGTPAGSNPPANSLGGRTIQGKKSLKEIPTKEVWRILIQESCQNWPCTSGGGKL